MKHILSAKKTLMSSKEIFQLSLELGKYHQSDIIGSIMANTVHNTYWLYRIDTSHSNIQYEIKAIIKYSRIIKPKFREMIVHLFTNSENLKTNFTCLTLDYQKQANLILRNNGVKSKENSSKNYCLFDEEDQEYQYLKMSKVAANMFEI
jgi:hypothetical protein